ncbi:hypothetical protein EV198_3524 [Roseivirga ehrenbergii]|uniref:Uncharacterized protein n=1 Tax=Roseivirga ehrenbergii (strain DSM 102268 / JCM 13514 / KCTC 12282 / NCIMB 14502 / KMM 6017) TaxID=279360 RepID=A0A150WXQ9_ROSEK|nr:hypothetical protein [Roseivirga ehrenbergii]KYG71270.1 hypothetical protein MB14_10840 [Roseivirga ehrenbergii]TCK99692.1 hypothetical protein EV198_3524 [Roseivirga ehrenbergii]
MKKLILLSLSFFFVFTSYSSAQIVGENYEIEQQLLASTKQLNQFFKRFNGEEDVKGRTFEPDDRQYRNERLRKKYLSILFDEEDTDISSQAKNDFIERVTQGDNPEFLNLHSTDWFAVVNTTFLYKGKEMPLLLYMKIQQEALGYEWVIADVAFDPYKTMFDKQRGETKVFLHPMSHELDFMNLRKALVKGGVPESYTLADYKPDFLTIFLYEVKMGILQFQTVNRMNYHFFGIDGWYFSLTNFNRANDNSGWLISDLLQVNTSQKEDLLKIIYEKK